MFRSETEPPKAIIVQPLQGLANRLRVLASAAITAKRAGRTLYLDWRADERCGAGWNDLFQNEIPGFPGPWSPSVRVYQKEPVNFSQPGPGDLVDDAEDIVVVRTYFSFKPRNMSMREHLREKAEFYRGLVPVAEVREPLDELQERHFQGRRVVGVHIRRSDLVVAGDPSRFVSPTSMFVERMRRLAEQWPDVMFFLSTDDSEDKDRLFAELPGRVFTYSKTEIRRDTVEGIRDALVDWLALSKTMLVIRSAGTSFSREAAVLGGVPIEAIKRPLWPYTRYRFWAEKLGRGMRVAGRMYWGA